MHILCDKLHSYGMHLYYIAHSESKTESSDATDVIRAKMDTNYHHDGRGKRNSECGLCGSNTRPSDCLMKFDFSLTLSQLS
jgi:hypothetical protein